MVEICNCFKGTKRANKNPIFYLYYLWNRKNTEQAHCNGLSNISKIIRHCPTEGN